MIRWIETHCVYTNGEWVGGAVRLLLWQKLFILALFSVDQDGRRIYRWALLGVAKKNGKTELAAWLALYFLIADGEPSPLVVCAAASDDQADRVFGAARRCVEFSNQEGLGSRAFQTGGPALADICEVYDSEIQVPSIPGSVLKRVAAAGGTNDGENIHVVICDELHEWMGKKGRSVWTILTNGTGSRRQPLVLQITTAGYDNETVCGEQYEYGRRVAEDPSIDPRYLMWWFEPPEGAPHGKVATWVAANPSWGHTLPDPETFFRDQLPKKTEAEFRRYFCNQWTEVEEVWEVASVWDDLAHPRVRPNEKIPACVGIDIGLSHDSSAIVLAQKVGKRIVLRAWIRENPYPKGHSEHDRWRFNIAEAKQHLRELHQRFRSPARRDERGRLLPGPAFFYDKNFIEDVAQELAGEGLNMVEYPQSDAYMVPASQGLFQLALGRVIAHDGDKDLRRHIRNVIARPTNRGWRIDKRKATKKVDGAIAAAIAASEAAREVPQSKGPNLW